MRIFVVTSFLLLCFLGKGTSYAQELRISTKSWNADSTLENSWKHFVQVILNDDLRSFTSISTSCIKCSNCSARSNTSELILEEEFFKVDYKRIFDQNTISRIQNPDFVTYINNIHNQKYYSDQCILSSTALAKPCFVEVLVTYLDPNGKFEGAQHAFAFIETKDGYLFCGYSTIP